jgi:hypothetical protein
MKSLWLLKIDVRQSSVCPNSALLSPSTGVLDSHTYYLNLLADCEEACVRGVANEGGGFANWEWRGSSKD